MKPLLLLAALFTLAPLAQAGPHVYATDKQLESSRKAVANALLAVSVNDSDWSIFVVPEKEWKAALHKGQRGHTAFTLTGKLTYINAQWIQDVHGDSSKLAPILAHEYGHILCDCTDEGVAEGYVSTLVHQR